MLVLFQWLLEVIVTEEIIDYLKSSSSQVTSSHLNFDKNYFLISLVVGGRDQPLPHNSWIIISRCLEYLWTLHEKYLYEKYVCFFFLKFFKNRHRILLIQNFVCHTNLRIPKNVHQSFHREMCFWFLSSWTG